MRRFQLNGKYEYCPNGNYWSDISGIFDKELYLFCECNKCEGVVYVLRPINITKKIKPETIKNAKKQNKLEDLRYKVNYDNMDKVEKLLTNK